MKPLQLASLESFYIGGVEHTITRRDGLTSTRVSGAMYVQRLVPVRRSFTLPVVMIHGGVHTGATWETTPDGREGWQTLFVRHGFEVLVIDQAWRGRSAPDLAFLDPWVETNEAIGPVQTWGMEMVDTFSRGGGRFPLDSSRSYAAQLWPDFFVHRARSVGKPALSDPRALPPLVELLDKIGRAVLITHSQSAHAGWQLAVAQPDRVAAIYAIEPGLVAPGLDDPRFPAIRVQIVWGDNLPQDGAALTMKCVAEARALAQSRPGLSVDLLPDHGIFGNGHMLMMEDNNDVLADRAMAWLRSLDLD